jgi:predicted transposase YbfD/YdcC
MEISGCLVTIDAMGCQTEIAQEIVDAHADEASTETTTATAEPAGPETKPDGPWSGATAEK